MTLEELLLLLKEKYPNDKTAPGIMLSFVDDKYYLAIHRFEGAFGRGRKVIMSHQMKNLDKLINTMAKKFLSVVEA